LGETPQVTVVVYVFCKSWSSPADKRLLAAAILLFIIGIFKCFNKPSALKRASFNSVVTTFRPAPRTKTAKREVELEEYIQEARRFVQGINKNPPAMDSDSQSSHLEQLSMPDKLFVDYAYVFEDRLTTLKSFWLIGKEATYEAICMGLSETFNLVYTKDIQGNDKNRITPRCGNTLSGLIVLLNLLLPIVPIGLFHSSHKKAYRGSDIKVTFILLYITYFLELVSFFTLMASYREWSHGIAQHSLIGLLARNRRHARLMGIAEFFQCKGLLDTYFGWSCQSSKDITMLVYEHVKAGWMSDITDIESYWRFCDSRGQWSLERNGGEEILLWSIEKPFDESIILWHVATEFFFHMKGTSPDFECARMCRQVSNYMMHLLFANPEMLLPGSRRNLFTVAYDELEVILQGDDLSLLDERGVTLRIVNKAELPEGFIRDSWVLAQELMRLGDEINKMWEVIKDVWIEMLCFSAGRCRGYLHAKSLGSGGEYLSYVSLLMSHAGLETYAERQQRVQLRLPKEERVKIAKQRIQEGANNQATVGSLTPQGIAPVGDEYV
jgi:hypothetical protein